MRAQRRLEDAFRRGSVHQLSAPISLSAGQQHVDVARRDAEAVEEHAGDEAEEVEEVEQEEEVSPQRELVAVIETAAAAAGTGRQGSHGTRR